MSLVLRHRSIALVLSFSFLSSSVAFAADPKAAESSETQEDTARSNARKLASEASEAYRLAQYDLAYDRFNRAFRLVGVPALGVWSARSLERGGRLVEASERYREILRLKAPADGGAGYAEAIQNARAELDELLPRIPNLVIRLVNAEGADVRVTVNDAVVQTELLEVKQRVNPGKLKVRGDRRGEIVEQEITVGERQVKEVVLEFSRLAPVVAGGPTPAPHPATQETPNQGMSGLQTDGLVGMGTGGLLLVGGIVTGAIDLGQESSIAERCSNPDTRQCAATGNLAGDISDFNTMRTLSSVGFIAGGVLLGAGFTLYFVGDSSSEGPSVGLWTAGTSGGLRGQF